MNTSKVDIRKLTKQEEIWFKNQILISNCNYDVLLRYASFLQGDSCYINESMVTELTDECGVSREYAVYILFLAALQWNPDESDFDKTAVEQYVQPYFKKQNPLQYQDNPYYKHIHIPDMKHGKWELRQNKYEPYEVFVYDDLYVSKRYHEIPCLGYFQNTFHFPAILQDGNEWMTITPNEINTMQPVIDEIYGDVITFGLGMGYFAFMASQKESVKRVVIVERNSEVITLFEEMILPQFPNHHKIEVVQEDAFAYGEQEMKSQQFEFAFVDIWHDVSDGVDCYMKMKKLEKYSASTAFRYWIEESLLSKLRHYVFYVIVKKIHQKQWETSDAALLSVVSQFDMVHQSQNRLFLNRCDQIARYLGKFLGEGENLEAQLQYALSKEFLQKMACHVSWDANR